MDVKLVLYTDCSRYKNIFMMKINPDKIRKLCLVAHSLYIDNPLGNCDLNMFPIKNLFLEITSFSLYCGFQS